MVSRLLLAAAALGGTLASVGLLAAAPQAAAAPPTYTWPKAGGNNANSDMSLDPSVNATNAATFGVKWMVNTGQEVLASPTVDYIPALAKTLIFVGNETGYFTAFDQATGLPLWSVQMSGPIRDSAVSDGTSVWVGDTHADRLIKLNAATGAVECSALVGNTGGETIDSSPLLATPPGGVATVYVGVNDVGSFNGPLTAVNAASCAIEFQSTPEPKAGTGGIWDFLNYSVNSFGTPLVLFGTADPDSAVYAINAKTGAGVWRYAVDNPAPGTYDVGAGVTTTAPGVNGFADGMAYVPSKLGILYALDLTTGALVWKFNFAAVTGQNPGGSLATPAISGTNVVIDVDGGTLDVNAVTGAEVWYASSSGAGVDAAPAIVGPTGNQVVANMTTSGLFQILSLSSGSLLYSYQTGNFAVGSVANTDGNLIDSSGDGFLYDFAPGGGNGGTPTTAVTAPKNGVSVPYSAAGLAFSGTTSDTVGVAGVNVDVQMNGSTGLWWNGTTQTWQTEPYPNQATVVTPGATSSKWSYTLPVPFAGGNFKAFVSTVGNNAVADVASEESPPNSARSEVTVKPKTGQPAIATGKPFVAPGGSVQVTGSGFAASEGVGFAVEGLTLNSLKATSTGTVSGMLTMPTSMTYGSEQLTATGKQSGRATTAPLYVSSTWSQFGGNSALDAFDTNDSVLAHHLSVSAPSFLQQAWTFSTGAPIDGSVLVQNQVAYVADSAGHIDAINIPTGGQLWSTSTPDGSTIVNTPALTQGGFVAAATTSGEVFEVNQTTGAIRWSVTPGGDFVSSPTVAGTTLYVANSAGAITALNAATGATLWSVSVGSAVAGGISVDPVANMLFVGDAGGSVVALNATTGATDWTAAGSGSFTAAPMALGSVVYAGSTSGTVYAMAEATGAVKWTYNAGAPISAPLASEAGEILVGTPTGHVLYLTGKGTLTFDVSLSGKTLTGMAAGVGFVASQTSDGTVFGSKPAATDPRAWVATTGTTFKSSPTIVNGEVFVTGQDGTVRCYTLPGSPPV
jgi:outer membrane protein assembly factor BamB